MENDAFNSSSIVACIRCRWNVSTVPFPCNCKGDTQIDIQIDVRDFLIRQLRWAQVHTKFYKDWVRHSKVDKRGYTDTHRQQGDLICLLFSK
jgi:hypothetical protein